MKLVPAVTSVEMATVDQAMVEDYGIDFIQMMENAGRVLAAMARDRFLDGDPRGKTVVVLAGPGGNGGGALVAGRRLHGWVRHVRTSVSSISQTSVFVGASTPRSTFPTRGHSSQRATWSVWRDERLGLTG